MGDDGTWSLTTGELDLGVQSLSVTATFGYDGFGFLNDYYTYPSEIAEFELGPVPDDDVQVLLSRPVESGGTTQVSYEVQNLDPGSTLLLQFSDGSNDAERTVTANGSYTLDVTGWTGPVLGAFGVVDNPYQSSPNPDSTLDDDWEATITPADGLLLAPAPGLTLIDTTVAGATAAIEYEVEGLGPYGPGFVTFTGSVSGEVIVDVLADGTYTADISGLQGEVSAFLSYYDPTNLDPLALPETVNAVGQVDPVCFCAGTRIATPGGEAAVEGLRPGDLVLTADGGTAPVLWLGRQTVRADRGDPLAILPIRIRAGALAEGVPSRDLRVSPAHALLVGGVLVQAGALVNGTSILREQRVPRVFQYFHVELAAHSLLLAEGAPAESFVDTVDRSVFDNGAERLVRAGGAAPIPEMDLPRAASHRQVPRAVRALIEARAAALMEPVRAAA